ncbi:hypothetical protein EST38_g7403 [Candolleomyces aberdarensis]|uniref:Mitochondrial genome maintenance protein Mgr2 n=1 Tax=Candolleomyces aberdarensis TaxID=2316362 RepID=A0A4Q2DF73_9AGAR|nr:hypothetical protein EST38_g7403 [Candolleomyces aberdarensis]
MPPVPQNHGHGFEAPSIWQKMKMGALMGGGVGLTIGFIFGSWSIIRHGAGPRGLMATLSQYMLSSAATFSFFLSIGSVIRSDSPLAIRMEAMQHQLAASNPLIRSKLQSAQIIRARWQQEKHQAEN